MRNPSRVLLLLSSLVLTSACDSLPGAGVHSLANSAKEHPSYWEVEANEASRFGEVARVTKPGMTWLYTDLELGLPRGRYLLDFRIAAAEGLEENSLRLQAEPECDALAASTWVLIPQGSNVWVETPEPLEFVVRDRCTVKISLLGEDGSKQGWGLDWARVRACGEGEEIPCPSGETP